MQQGAMPSLQNLLRFQRERLNIQRLWSGAATHCFILATSQRGCFGAAAAAAAGTADGLSSQG